MARVASRVLTWVALGVALVAFVFPLYYLRPLLLLVLFFRIADVLRVFDHVYVLTGGGPGATTEFLSLYLYRVGFRFSDLGQASALAVVVMVAMTLLYSVITRFLPAEKG